MRKRAQGNSIMQGFHRLWCSTLHNLILTRASLIHWLIGERNIPTLLIEFRTTLSLSWILKVPWRSWWDRYWGFTVARDLQFYFLLFLSKGISDDLRGYWALCQNPILGNAMPDIPIIFTKWHVFILWQFLKNIGVRAHGWNSICTMYHLSDVENQKVISTFMLFHLKMALAVRG